MSFTIIRGWGEWQFSAINVYLTEVLDPATRDIRASIASLENMVLHTGAITREEQIRLIREFWATRALTDEGYTRLESLMQQYRNPTLTLFYTLCPTAAPTPREEPRRCAPACEVM
jgi:hypothetical protein